MTCEVNGSTLFDMADFTVSSIFANDACSTSADVEARVDARLALVNRLD